MKTATVHVTIGGQTYAVQGTAHTMRGAIRSARAAAMRLAVLHATRHITTAPAEAVTEE